MEPAQRIKNCPYETQTILNEYILFHYGLPQDNMPYSLPLQEALDFPRRCVEESLNQEDIPSDAIAADLGCAVGGASFQLTRYFQRVIAIDLSSSFIEAAKDLQQRGYIEYAIKIEGENQAKRQARLPENIHPQRVSFFCADVLKFSYPAPFHTVLAANLLCRLKDPFALLDLLPALVLPGGQLILTSPYSWLEEFTLKEHWLGGEKTSFSVIQSKLNPYFELKCSRDMPFLIREHIRKFQLGMAHATIWKRKN